MVLLRDPAITESNRRTPRYPARLSLTGSGSKLDCANLAALAPGNDTRVNLLLLLADQHGLPASAAPAPRPLLDWKDFKFSFTGSAAEEDDSGPFATGEGSRCRSVAAGEKGFTDAVQAAAGLPPNERNALTEARASLAPRCSGTNDAPASTTPTDVTSPEGRSFAAYLQAAKAFYAASFIDARAGFEALQADPDP